MSVEPARRALLPLAAGHGGRSAMTCLYRCANACSHPAPNDSANPYFGDLVTAEMSRRGVIRAAAAGGVVISAAATGAVSLAGAASAVEADPTVPAVDSDALRTAGGSGALTFKAIPPNKLDTVIVPNGYDHNVIIRWGDPVERDAPAFNPFKQTAAAQAKQFGYNNDFLVLIPLDRRFRQALLVVNHEYTNEELMFPGYTGPDGLSVEQIKVAIAAHGMSIVEVERVGDSGEWVLERRGARRYNRRLTAGGTRFAFTGPAAGLPLLRTASDPQGRTVLGSLNNCAGGLTPWGTFLSGEENFNQYFVGGEGAPAHLQANLRRYGIDTTVRYPAGNRKWDRADQRFDLTKHPHEAHRFGWICEVDPFDPKSTPRKHTALGRLKHEGAEIILSKNDRVVAYMGDDERFDYLYKFVSTKRMDKGQSPGARRHNLTLLESGDLYVARFEFTSAAEIDGSGKLPTDGAFNGRGRWLPLVKNGVSTVPGMSIEEVLVFTRLAADKAGATKMDRPEDVQPSPKTGKVYVALTNNTRRGAAGQPGVDEANPRTGNRHGHVLELIEDGGDNASESFAWSLPIVCGDPSDPSSYFAGYDKSKVSPISCPDNLDFDAAGNLWISTDGNALGSNDGLFAVALEGPEKGLLKQFLTVPTGAEQASAYVAPDNRTVVASVQHPGELEGASFDKPASTWPDGDYARPAVIGVWRLDGRSIGL